jgi:hypothetical protein
VFVSLRCVFWFGEFPVYLFKGCWFSDRPVGGCTDEGYDFTAPHAFATTPHRFLSLSSFFAKWIDKNHQLNGKWSYNIICGTPQPVRDDSSIAAAS